MAEWVRSLPLAANHRGDVTEWGRNGDACVGEGDLQDSKTRCWGNAREKLHMGVENRAEIVFQRRQALLVGAQCQPMLHSLLPGGRNHGTRFINACGCGESGEHKRPYQKVSLLSMTLRVSCLVCEDRTKAS